MGKKVQLFLHIGHPKSGSTTLQSYFFQNWQSLKKAGFEMPTSRLELANTESPPGNLIAYLQTMRETGDLQALPRWVEAASKRSSKLLLSAECFAEWFWHKPFVPISDHVDIHLIYYVRRQDELLLSAWRQWGLKRGLSLDAFIKSRLADGNPDFMKALWPWQNKVKTKSFHVRFIGKQFLYQHSLTADVSNRLGIDTEHYQSVENQNLSVDARLLLFMSKRPQYFASIHDDSIFTLLTSGYSEAVPARLSLTPDQFHAVKEALEASNQELLKEYHPEMFGTPVIDMASAPLEAEEPPYSEEDQITYIKKCLEGLENCQDNRIISLRQEFLC